MMKRPADQAKLLFLYFLRYSSAAFASEPIKSSLSKNSPTITLPSHSTASSSSTSTILDGHISLRTARRTDIPSIQRCNLATLPENYNSNFYMHHIRTWPELALVMEHVPKGYEERYAKRRPSGSCYYNEDRPLEVIGYVLGKVEQRPRPGIPPRPMLPRSKVHPDDDHHDGGFRARDYSTLSRPSSSSSREMLGHVTSLAILDSYRRRGLANQLMDQLHYHMRERYEADAVGLHVRVSNVAATKLYVETMGYTVADIIKGYYQDGEDAYLMRKEFELEEEEALGNGGMNGSLESRSRSGGRRWFSGLGGGRGRDDWRPVKGMELPRKIPLLARRKDEQPQVGDVSRVCVNSRQDGGERRVVVRGQQQLFSH